MNTSQKIAWFTLAVITLALAAYLILLKLTGHPEASTAGFALLGLLGCSPLFLGRRKGVVLLDERDREIERKAGQAGFFVFWLYFVAFCVLVPFHYGRRDVPSFLLTLLCLAGVMVLLAARSVAVLVLYRRDSDKSGTFLESFREMTDLQRSSWIGLIILLFIISCFLWFFPLGQQNIVADTVGVSFLLTFTLLFYLMRKSWRVLEMDEDDRKVLRGSERTGLLALAVSAALGSSGLAVLQAAGTPVTPDMVCYTGFCAVAAGLLAQPVSVLAQYATRAHGTSKSLEP
ncbi:MAG: hypothetical protein JXQ83_05750 [Candidatus Glassbacteria bacterium]|nr:hypothetical protein [Candidatus Glassbacteria bacterium]